VGVGAHWNFNQSPVHGCPEIDGPLRHNGDLGNWDVDANGFITQNKTIPDLINLSGIDSIVGRSLALHRMPDPCTNGTVYGPRIATCVIGVQNTSALNITNAASNANPNTAAVCFLLPTQFSNITGSVWFFVNGSSTTVVGQLHQISGVHGMHIHQFGDLRADNGLASGGHWNPNAAPHGIPPYTPRHVGDMGNIYSYDNNGTAWYYHSNDLLPLSGPSSIIGRTLTVHISPDDCSNPTGAAGTRLAQCVVGIYNTTYNPAPEVPPEIQSTQNITSCLTRYATTAATVVSGTNNANNGTLPNTNGGTSTVTQIPLIPNNSNTLVPLVYVTVALLMFVMKE